MTIETTRDKPKSTALAIKDWMSAPSMQSALEAALSGYMDSKTFAAQCYLAAQDPKIAKCSAASLFRAFLECAQMGLLPGSHHRHVALIPRGDQVTPMPQWQGFKFLMERQPGIRRVRPVLVHTADKFELVHGEPHHEYDPFDSSRVFEHWDVASAAKRECKLRGGYLVIEYDDGRDTEFHFVSADKIRRNSQCADTQNVWKKWFQEQCLKTVIRDAWARRIVSIDPQLAQRLGKADETDNASTGSDPQRAEITVTTAPANAKTSKVDALAAQLGAADDRLPDMGNADTREPITAEHEEVRGEPGSDG